jgi:hypothetical protein
MPDPNQIVARLPDGTELRFPAGTPDAVISRVIRAETGQSRGPMDVAGAAGGEIGDVAKGLWSAGNTALNTIQAPFKAWSDGTDYEPGKDPGLQAVANTARGLGSLVGGAANAAYEGLTKDGDIVGPHALASAYRNPAIRGIAEDYAGRYGGWENVKDSVLDHPLRTLSDVATVASPALKAGGAAAAARGMTGTARAAALANDVINPLEGVSDITKAIATKAGPRFQNGARGLTRRSLNLSTRDLIDKPSARAAVGAQLEQGTLPTAGGYDRIEEAITGLQGEKRKVFNANPNARAATDTPQLDDWTMERYRTANTDEPGFTGAQKVRDIYQTRGPNAQPVLQLPAGGTMGRPLPATLPVAELDEQRNRLGAVLNKVYQAGEDVPPSSVTDAQRRLYSDLTDSVHTALPGTVPLDAKLSPLHSLTAQLKRGPLASVAQQSTHPTGTAQIGSFLGRQFGTGQALAGHGFNKLGGGLRTFGATPNTYTGMAPQAFTTGGLLEDVERAADEDETLALARELRGVRY